MALVDAEVDLTALDAVDGLGHASGGDGAGLRVGHQAARAQDTRDQPTLAIWSGWRSRRRSRPAALDLLDQVLGAHLVGAGVASAALSPTANTITLAVLPPVPVGQIDGASNHLIYLTGSTPRRIATSTVASVFFDSVLGDFTASAGCTAWTCRPWPLLRRRPCLFLLMLLCSFSRYDDAGCVVQTDRPPRKMAAISLRR